ncbi:MAG TPA: carotenoid oxygenase family protein [Acidimicrobiales bacterium]|nr:carotenoid oxygenase family protein [Acidimicrobiales bacterium]
MSLTTSADSPFLQGLMAPVFDERDDRDLQVTGQIPAGLRGMFVRNGPNPQFAPKTTYHPFDGDGMLHAVYFEEGQVRYRNRWIESKGLQIERRRGEALYGGLAEFTMPDPDVVAEGGVVKNTANTNVVRHAGRILALLEAALPTEVTPELETRGEYDFDGRLASPFTAHPKIDPVSGEMLFFGYAPFPPYLRYHVVSADGELVQTTDIDLPNPVMIHDFAVTEHHAVFLDSPAIFDVPAMVRGEPMMHWAPEAGTRIGVLPRRGGSQDIRWFDLENQYVVHFFNAWDDGDRVEVRAPRFSHMPGAFDFETPTGEEAPMPWAWSIDLATGTVESSQTDDRGGEFPRVNDALATRRTRYGYNCLARTWEFEFEFHGVVKYDEQTGTSQERFYGESEVSGEHVFAPDPDGTAEDDGWLLSFVADRADDTTDLVILDAHDITAEPVARVHIPRRVPIGFHANWLPTS